MYIIPESSFFTNSDSGLEVGMRWMDMRWASEMPTEIVIIFTLLIYIHGPIGVLYATPARNVNKLNSLRPCVAYMRR